MAGVIVGQGVSVRIGARELISDANFRVEGSMRVGLVGRNGAGKTTLTGIMAGEGVHSEAIEVSGQISRKGSIGYLPQDPRTGDLSQTAQQRVLSARGIDTTIERIRKAERQMATTTGDKQIKAMERYSRLDAEFTIAGGWAAQSEAFSIAAALGLDKEVLAQQLSTLSGGQRRRVELARILFQAPDTLLLDEPTNHLDHDSLMWLRDYLKTYPGAIVMISHAVDLVSEVVTDVWFLDAMRAKLDVYHMGWKRYLTQRAADESRRKKEREQAERKYTQLMRTAERMKATATKASAAQSMMRRAERILAETQAAGPTEKVAALRFPSPAPCGKVPLTATSLGKTYGSTEVFTGVDLAIDRGSKVAVLGLNGAGKTTLLRLLAGVEDPTSGQVIPGHGLRVGYYAQEHETLDVAASVEENMRAAAPDLDDTEVRNVLGSFLFSGDDVTKPAGVLSGGEKTRLSLAALVVSQANVLLLDEPTNNLDPASREEILRALRTYEGAVVLVTHDPGAVEALGPERVLLLPDGDEDLWSDDYLELVTLA